MTDFSSVCSKCGKKAGLTAATLSLHFWNRVLCTEHGLEQSYIDAQRAELAQAEAEQWLKDGLTSLSTSLKHPR